MFTRNRKGSQKVSGSPELWFFNLLTTWSDFSTYYYRNSYSKVIKVDSHFEENKKRSFLTLFVFAPPSLLGDFSVSLCLTNPLLPLSLSSLTSHVGPSLPVSPLSVTTPVYPPDTTPATYLTRHLTYLVYSHSGVGGSAPLGKEVVTPQEDGPMDSWTTRKNNDPPLDIKFYFFTSRLHLKLKKKNFFSRVIHNFRTYDTLSRVPSGTLFQWFLVCVTWVARTPE